MTAATPLTSLDDFMAALTTRFEALTANPERVQAWDTFKRMGLPSKRQEDWRWSDFGESLGRKPGGSPSLPALPKMYGVHIHLTAQGFAWPNDLPDGLSISPSPDPIAMGRKDSTPMAALARALSGGHGAIGSLNLEITKPLNMPIILHVDARDSDGVFGQIQGLVRADARLEIIEIYENAADLTALSLAWQIDAQGELLRNIVIMEQESGRLSSFCDIIAREKATYQQNMLGFGAQWARCETQLTFTNPHATAKINAASLVGPALHLDATTRVIHDAQSCETTQKHKSVVKAGGQSIFQGKFIVPRTTGQFTQAEMSHDALLLENGAAVFAKPELEIYADDVECAHGNTSGSPDAQALFYMRQRGIPQETARAMLTYAFVAEVLSDAPAFFAEFAAEWLGVDRTWLESDS